MVLRMTALAALAFGLFGLAGNPVASQEKKDDAKPKPEDAAKAKKALMEVQDFIGLWNLEGTQKAGGKTEAWKEKVSWGWKFKDGDSWITVDFAEGKGKYFTAGALRYDVEKKKYLLTLTAADKSEQVYEGGVVKGELKLERKEVKTADVYRVTVYTLADGVRMQMKFEKQEGGKGLFASQFALSGSKDGESIAGGGPKKPECIVSGGAASIAVSYQGKTYYVCCTGCRDEFLASPEKYINAKKK
jgi:YHS domain-containing protein